MPAVIICSICSKEKEGTRKLLPARKRYRGSHIALVEAISEKEQAPLFILSGRYGLLAAGELVPYYDYFLQEKDFRRLVPILVMQLRQIRAAKVYFYTKTKETWAVYQRALSLAADTLGISLEVVQLPDTA